MNHDEREVRITAFALGDASVTDAERAKFEAAIAGDSDTRREVAETQAMARMLENAFMSELVVQPASTPITVPSEKENKRHWLPRRLVYGVPAAVVLVLGIFLGAGQLQQVREASAIRQTTQADLDEFRNAQTPHHLKHYPDDPKSYRWNPTTEDLTKAFEEPQPNLTNPDIGLDPQLPAIVNVTGPGNVVSESIPPPPSVVYNPTTGVPSFESIHRPDPRSTTNGEYPHPSVPRSGDRFGRWIENPFIRVEGQAALSTFGVDVDTASYSILRKHLTDGQLPPTDAVRLEEIVNYFPYQDKPPTGEDPFAATVELADCPWRAGHKLARIGLKAKPLHVQERPASNLVFLVDVSGSMSDANKLPLVKTSLKMLAQQLGENDRVAIVVYAGASGLVLPSTNGTRKDTILPALERLEAGGSTNGAGGLQQAYDVAVANFIKGGTNRVILCTDGDWNVGVTGTEPLVRMIEEKRKTGVFLSVFGFGMGNLRDEMMVRLAGKGNGNYGYIDSVREARKAFVEQLTGTLVTVAKDVKIQVEFNPAAVSAYRLLGYEKRALEAKDFDDDTKDAGEMGAGHTVTALYELVPAGTAVPAPAEGLRYQPGTPQPLGPNARNAEEAFVVKMRHKKPDGDVSTLRELPVPNRSVRWEAASEDFRFSAAAAAFALVLRNSAYKGDASLDTALRLAEGATRFDPNGHRAEFIDLVHRAKAIVGRP